MPFPVMLLIWLVAYVGLLVWSLAKKGRFLGGGVALIALSLFPMTYGRWTTASEWHDYPGMAVYYVPTFLGLLVSLVVLVAGLVITIRRALLTRPGA